MKPENKFRPRMSSSVQKISLILVILALPSVCVLFASRLEAAAPASLEMLIVSADETQTETASDPAQAEDSDDASRRDGRRRWRPRDDDRDSHGRGGPEDMRDRRGRFDDRMPPDVRELMKDPEKRKDLMNRIRGKKRLDFLKEQAPELYEAFIAVQDKQNEVYELVKEFNSTEDEAKKAELQKKIETEGAVLFDLQTKHQTLELDHMRKRLESLEKMLQERGTNHDVLVREHIEKIMTEDPDENPILGHRGWPPGPPPPGEPGDMPPPPPEEDAGPEQK